MFQLKVGPGVEAQEGEAFIRVRLVPGKVQQPQRAEQFFQRLTGPQAAHRVEAALAGNALPEKGPERAAGLVGSLQDGDLQAFAGEDPSAYQAAQAGAYDDHASGHSG